jgi:hypothetical protein
MKMSQLPWTYEADEDCYNDRDGTRFIDLNAISYDAKSRFARVDPGPTSQADARLIAAAPDLLAACEALPLGCQFDDAADFKDNAGAFLRAMELARNAIAKARATPE